jgi:hypothetical protein
MGKTHTSLGTMWLAVDPKGRGMTQFMDSYYRDCWWKIERFIGLRKGQLVRIGYRVVKVELREIP